MKAIAINGSHRAGASTSRLLRLVLDGLESRGWDVELVELSQLDIAYCTGCSACLKGRACPLEDDLGNVVSRIQEADAVVLGTPNYFQNVTARMKCFMDRMRPQHLAGDVLGGKAAGLVCTTGLSDLGVDCALAALRRFCDLQGWVALGSHSVIGSWQEGVDQDGRALYRKSAAIDPRAVAVADKLAAQLDSVSHNLAG